VGYLLPHLAQGFGNSFGIGLIVPETGNVQLFFQFVRYLGLGFEVKVTSESRPSAL
jgi:hypothetical protein